MRLGIDFGTCYSSAALTLNGKLKPIKEPFKHGFSFPSSIFVNKQGEIVIGYAAESQRRLDPLSYCHEFKRDLGRTIPYEIGNKSMLPEKAISHLLYNLKLEAEKVANQDLKSAVITIPASYQAYKQELMEQAAKHAGFEEVDLLKEPVAAAIYYAQTSDRDAALQDGDIMLVYDLGGGTFDAALIQKRGLGYELLAQPIGDEHCGGIDFDRQILNDLKVKCQAQIGDLLDPQRRDPTAIRMRLAIGDWCREFKHQLSVVTEYEDMLPIGEAVYSLDRSTFENSIAPFIRKTCTLCQQLVDDAGLKWGQVTRILMVGGSCRIPYVRQSLEREFARPVVQVDELELAVCLGATIFANEQKEQQRQEADIKAQAEQDRVKQQQFESKRFAEQDYLRQQQFDSERLEAEIAARSEKYRKWTEQAEALARSQQIRITTISIRNLPDVVTQGDLAQTFSEYGTVVNIVLQIDPLTGRNQGFAFVGMKEAEADRAINALDGAEWIGKYIQVSELGSSGVSQEEFERQLSNLRQQLLVIENERLEATIRANAEETAGKNQNQVAMVCVRRANEFQGAAVSCDVLINDEVVGNLWAGQEVMIPYPVGTISIKVKAKAWLGMTSPSHTLDLSPSHTTIFECGNGWPVGIYLKIIGIQANDEVVGKPWDGQ
jgi:actin-like ATPase involved in cell morphogenesis